MPAGKDEESEQPGRLWKQVALSRRSRGSPLKPESGRVGYSSRSFRGTATSRKSPGCSEQRPARNTPHCQGAIELTGVEPLAAGFRRRIVLWCKTENQHAPESSPRNEEREKYLGRRLSSLRYLPRRRLCFRCTQPGLKKAETSYRKTDKRKSQLTVSRLNDSRGESVRLGMPLRDWECR